LHAFANQDTPVSPAQSQFARRIAHTTEFAQNQNNANVSTDLEALDANKTAAATEKAFAILQALAFAMPGLNSIKIKGNASLIANAEIKSNFVSAQMNVLV
jgi:hypothetical protein